MISADTEPDPRSAAETRGRRISDGDGGDHHELAIEQLGLDPGYRRFSRPASLRPPRPRARAPAGAENERCRRRRSSGLLTGHRAVLARPTLTSRRRLIAPRFPPQVQIQPERENIVMSCCEPKPSKTQKKNVAPEAKAADDKCRAHNEIETAVGKHPSHAACKMPARPCPSEDAKGLEQ